MASVCSTSALAISAPTTTTSSNGPMTSTSGIVDQVAVSASSTIALSNVVSTGERCEWPEAGISIRGKRKTSTVIVAPSSSSTAVSAIPTSRSRSNSHGSSKKDLKNNNVGGVSTENTKSSTTGATATVAGETNNGSVIQDSGFSTETSSSKEGHSASSTNGALTAVVSLFSSIFLNLYFTKKLLTLFINYCLVFKGANVQNRLSCPESDDELLNLLDVIHRKSNRLREEVERLRIYEQQHQIDFNEILNMNEDCEEDKRLSRDDGEGAAASKDAAVVEVVNDDNNDNLRKNNTALTPKIFREHVERINRDDIKQLRRERDRLLDKLAEMEAETLTGRIKTAKMSAEVEELTNIKKELEEQLKLAMTQKLELNSRLQQLQEQQQHHQSRYI